jgi:hypothetical protein
MMHGGGTHRQRWTDPLYYQKVIIATQDPITGKIIYIAGTAYELIYTVDYPVDDIDDGLSVFSVRSGDPRAEINIKFANVGQTHVQPQWADIHRTEEIAPQRKELP